MTEVAYDFDRHEWVGQCPYGDVCTGCDARGHCTRREVEPGSAEEVELRGEWLSRLMFGWMIGQHDPGPYEAWLTNQGVRLV